MRARTFASCVVVIVALGLFLGLPASAASLGQRGAASIDVEGTFGDRVTTSSGATVLPFDGRVNISGFVSGGGDASGLVFNFTPGGLAGPIEGAFDAVTDQLDELVGQAHCSALSGGINGGACQTSGDLIGRGSLTILTLTPQPGGRIEFLIDLPDALCIRCPTRP
jgi:hypothetical protein